MLKLTKKADYGLIALKHLAVDRPADSASAKDIADTYGIPLPLLSKILQKLVEGRLSALGAWHQRRLQTCARDPRDITALEIIRTIDGPIVLTSCFTEHGHLQPLRALQCPRAAPKSARRNPATAVEHHHLRYVAGEVANPARMMPGALPGFTK